MRFELITDAFGTYIWDRRRMHSVGTYGTPEEQQAHLDYLNNEYAPADNWSIKGEDY